MLAERGRQTALLSFRLQLARVLHLLHRHRCRTVAPASPQIAHQIRRLPIVQRPAVSRHIERHRVLRGWRMRPSSTTRSAVSGLSAVTVALPASAGMAKSVPSPLLPWQVEQYIA